jgi:hypothetical protein
MIIKLLVCFKVKHLSSLHIKVTYIGVTEPPRQGVRRQNQLERFSMK